MDTPSRRYQLKEDIQSGYNKNGAFILYGRKSEIVTEVADHDDVVIVANKFGNRFPVLKSLLKQWPPP